MWVQVVAKGLERSGWKHVFIVVFVVGAPCDKRLVWEHETDRERERFIGLACALFDAESIKEIYGCSGYILVVHLIGALTVSRLFETDASGTSRAREKAVVYAAPAHLIGTVVADESFGIAAQLVGAVGMHAPYEDGLVAARSHGMC